MFRLTCRIAILIAVVALPSATASAAMREITAAWKICNNRSRCLDVSRTATAGWLRIDWPSGALEFRGTFVKFGGTALWRRTDPDSEFHYTEPTRIQVSVEGYKLTIEVTTATQFYGIDHEVLFDKSTEYYLFEFGRDGECKSLSITKKVLKSNLPNYFYEDGRKYDTDGRTYYKNASCSGRIDIL